MAGIYIHIPFCKKRCIYCDFYSTTALTLRQQYVDAVCHELKERAHYLKGEKIQTIYFGGGTPSLLRTEHFSQLFRTIEETFGSLQCEEITLEANPDDLTDEYVQALASLPINRLSIGIQTFNDTLLKTLNRRHTAADAVAAVERCRQAGFHNISIDLIYGLPGETEQSWEADLQQAVSLGAQHISAYHLTYEEGTALWKLREKQQLREVTEEQSLRFFDMLLQTLQSAGYEHYEISNFCLPGYHSRHNSAYWQGVPYLGCGPAAHSYDRTSRQWNVASLKQYLQAIARGENYSEREELHLSTRYNEYVMVSLRTAQGIDLKKLKEEYGNTLYDYCLQMARPGIARGHLALAEQHLRLTRSGLFISDDILSDLMYL